MNLSNMSELLEVAQRAARAGGERLMHWFGRIQEREKGPRDSVTEADLASQQAIREVLLGQFPEHGFVGEEDDQHEATDDHDYVWIVDPLDGTANYVHQMRSFAVSIALLHHGEPLVGVVFDPNTGECFLAARGEGAWLDGERLSTSDCEQIDQALLAASFSAKVPRGSPEVRRFVAVLHESRALRRLGSAALNLAYVAAGRLDGYFATSVKIWDVAAGLLLVGEAGGVISRIDGQPLDMMDPRFVVASTPHLHGTLVGLLRSADDGQAST